MRKAFRTMCWLLVASVAGAGDAPGFVYQARLCRADGTAYAGTQRVTFTLWDAATGGSALWRRAVNTAADAQGLVSVTLGDDVGEPGGTDRCATLAEALLATNVFYLGVAVGTDAELTPRARVAPVPFAGNAVDVTSAGGDFRVAEKLSAATLDVRGEGSVTGKLEAQTAEVSGALRVTGRSGAQEGVAVSGGTAAFADTLEVAGNLAVTGAVTAATLAVSGDAAVAGTLKAGTLAVNGPFRVGGVNAALPKGVILCWDGARNAIPADWAVCDGNNGTPDLRGYFVPAAGGEYAAGSVGGADTVTLETKHLPAHTHGITFHTHGYAGAHNESSEVTGKKWNCNATTVTSATAGGGRAHENRPPYYALYYIMKIR